ncbi:MAG: hypothetical protein LBE22_10075 [Azoarcus sp.]|nr:hypothetical protein [Azoarcus sp.]
MKKTMTFPKFDAELNTDCCNPYSNAELTLTLRLGFRQINPAGGVNTGTYHDADGQPRKIIRWNPAAWSSWKARFVSSAQSFWTGKFWLINDSFSFPYKHQGVIYFPNVWCRLKLVGNEATTPGNHRTIDVVRLDPSVNWFGSHDTLYDSKDMDSIHKETTSTGKKVMQRAHVHEVGHLLGLDHVDVGKPHCPASGDTSADVCYGVSDHDMQSVMGFGMQLRSEHAYPWRESLRHFAREEMFSKVLSALSSASHARSLLGTPITSLSSVWSAKMQRHYPRTEAEMKAGTPASTIRPQRRGI